MARPKCPARFRLLLAYAAVLACWCLNLFAQTKSAPQPGQMADSLAYSRSLISQNRLADAEGELRLYLRAHADSAEAHYLLAHVLFQQKKARESLAEYTEGAKYRKPNASELLGVGADYVLLADYADADKWFSKAVEWEPQNPLGWYYLGRTKYNENRFEEALDAFEKCLKIEPQNVRAEDNLGLSLQALQRIDEAQQAFRTAIAWQAGAAKKDASPLLNWGVLLLEQNQPQQAKELLQQAREIAPNSVKARQQLGKAHFALGETDKAQAELEGAVELAPNDASAHYVLGQIYRKQGMAEKAKAQFAMFAKLNGTKAGTEQAQPDPTPPR